MFNPLSGLLPKAATQALIALAVTGGAIGASAAAGGPNIPQETLRAVGVVNEQADDHADDNGKAQAPGQIKKAAATATAGGEQDARDNGLKGLCNAYTKGGLGQKAKGAGTPAAAPLGRIDEARGGESRADFCEGVLEEHRPSATSTAEAGSQGKGKALGKSADGPGKSSAAPGKSR